MSDVSVVIPCYNAASFVAAAVESIMLQSLKPSQIICVDDGSTDATLKVLEGLKQKWPSLQIVAQENQGATAARNKGLDLAKAEYVQFMDADDILKPNKLKTQLAIAQEHDAPDIIIGAYQKYDDAAKLIYRQSQSEGQANYWIKLMSTKLGITSSNLFKRAAVVAAGKWSLSQRSSQEYELMFRMMKQGARISLCSEEQTEIHLRNPDSITSSSKGDNWKRYIELRLQMRSYALEHVPNVDSHAMNQIVFDSIRMLYPYDTAESRRLFAKEIPPDFTPSVSEFTSRGYVRMYKLVGFRRVEQIKKLF